MAEASLNYSITLHLDLNLRNRCNLRISNPTDLPKIHLIFTHFTRDLPIVTTLQTGLVEIVLFNPRCESGNYDEHETVSVIT